MSGQPIKDLPALMEAAADLLDRHHGVSGMRVAFHRMNGGSIRLMDRKDTPYTDEVCDIDLLSVAIGGEVAHVRNGLGGHAEVQGTWNGHPVTVSHLYFDVPREIDNEKPASDPAVRTAERIRDLIEWARCPWTQRVESLHVYDEDGSPRVHVVLLSDEGVPLDVAVYEMLDDTPGFDYRSESEYGFASYSSVLMPDGDTVLTISSIYAWKISSKDTS